MKKIILTLLVALPLSAMAQKFAHFNSETIITAMPEFTAMQTELQNKAKAYEDEFNKMKEELQTKGEDFEKNQATMVDAVKQRRQQELQDLYTRLQQYQQTSQEDLSKLQTEKMQVIRDKVMNAVKEVGSAGSYVYIMDTTSGIPYISESLSTDVTSQLKSKLGLK